MRLQAERQDRDADEKHRNQADDLRIIIVNTIPSINTKERNKKDKSPKRQTI
jgi:hypothetical protein